MNKNKKVLNFLNEKVKERLKTDPISLFLKPSFKLYGVNFINSAYNYETGREYLLSNRILLDNGFYLTLNQVKKLGGKVKKGAKTSTIFANFGEKKVFFNDNGKKVVEKLKVFEERPEKEQEKIKKGVDGYSDFKIFFDNNIKYYLVFNIKDIDGLPKIDHSKLYQPKKDGLPQPSSELNPLAEFLINNYIEHSGVKIIHDANVASSCYDYKNDTIYIKNFFEYKDSSDYYHQLYHELSHSTGKRLFRKFENNEETYSVEECIAEFSAITLMINNGLFTNKRMEEAINYLSGWYNNIQDKETNYIYKIIHGSEVAVDYFYNGKREKGE